MKPLRAKRIEHLEVEVLQDVEHYKCGEALRAGRDLQQIETAVVSRDRRYDLASVAGEIFRCQERAARSQCRHQIGGDLALVERARSFGGHGLEGLRQRAKADHVTFLWRRTVEQVMLGGAQVGF